MTLLIEKRAVGDWIYMELRQCNCNSQKDRQVAISALREFSWQCFSADFGRKKQIADCRRTSELSRCFQVLILGSFGFFSRSKRLTSGCGSSSPQEGFQEQFCCVL